MTVGSPHVLHTDSNPFPVSGDPGTGWGSRPAYSSYHRSEVLCRPFTYRTATGSLAKLASVYGGDPFDG